ncbi:MAG: tetratricopeptide repeat protein, partial [Pseudomonadota bacterium]
TESRVADARNRAAGFPARIYQDNPQFQLMRTRVEYSFFKNPDTAAEHFRKQRSRGGRAAVAAQYGLVLAMTDAGQFSEARALIQPMIDFAPQNMTYRLAEVGIDIAEKRYGRAIAKLQRGLQLVPGNHPMTMTLARAYFESERYAEADRLLSEHARSKSTNAYLWYVLAEVQGLAGNSLGLHQSRAEYFALNGALKQAQEQLGLALGLASDNVTIERINQRIVFFKQVEALLRQLSS